MKLRDLMTVDVSCCTPETNLEAAGQMMWDKDCGAIPVLDTDDRPVGMITDRDIAMSAVLNHKPLWDITAGEVTANRGVFACNMDEDIQTALSSMQTHKIRRVPVVDDDGRLRGLLSIDDLIARSERGASNKQPPLSYDRMMSTLKAVCFHH